MVFDICALCLNVLIAKTDNDRIELYRNVRV